MFPYGARVGGDAACHGSIQAIGIGLLILFVIGTFGSAASGDLRLDFAVIYVLFVLCSKVVLEQYLICAMPWLLPVAANRPRIACASLAVLGGFSLVGMVSNESFHPFGRGSPALSLSLAAACPACVPAAFERSHAARTPQRLTLTRRRDERPDRPFAPLGSLTG